MTNRSEPGDAIVMRGVAKEFFGATVLSDVDLTLRWGEIHALLGENGAGKSTLCSILAGLYRASAGEILLAGAPFHPHSPSEALTAGVGMVYQHFRLVDEMTVAENIVLGHPDTPAGVSSSWLLETTQRAMETHGLWVEPTAYVGDLSVGEKQRVEVMRLLHRGVRLLILDEPTAVLTPAEATALFEVIGALADRGHAIVLVTHKLQEVKAAANVVTVLRSGRNEGHYRVADTTPQALARLMIGHDLEATPNKLPTLPDGEGELLSLRSISVPGEAGARAALSEVSLDVERGRIVGIAGVSGNGQRELAEVVTGLRATDAGTLSFLGRDITTTSAAERADLGIGFVPEDRLSTGLALGLGIEDNTLLRGQRDARFRRGPFLRLAAIRSWARDLISRFDIRGVRRGLPVSVLSGGNLQRLILARELSREPSLLVAAEPTRGLDVGAADAIRRLLVGERDRGAGVLLISGDLEEILLLSDVVAVIHEGRIVATRDAGEVDIDEVGRWMAGVQ